LVVTLSKSSLLAQIDSIALSAGSTVAGGTVSLPLTFTGSGSTAGLQWAFSYPVSSVTAITAAPGPVLTAAGKSLYCNGISGVYTCLATGLNAAAIGNGTVATVSITVAPTSGNSLIGNYKYYRY